MKDEFSPTGGGVDILSETLKPYFSLVEFGDSVNKMLERPS